MRSDNEYQHPLFQLTAHSFALYDCGSQEMIVGKKETMKREVASLTKMMTFYTVLKLMRKWQMNPRMTSITISMAASQIQGTSANLVEGDVLTVEQLFYGMMLPSGNDAAYALAEYFGKIISERKQGSLLNQNSIFQNTPVAYFIKEMNSCANKLGMTGTNYDSPHGLMNKSNYSTAEDQAIMVREIMKSDIVRRVVATTEFETQAIGGRDRQNLTVYNWENTNKLLGKMPGIIGTKTGITQAAGPCFAGFYEDPDDGT